MFAIFIEKELNQLFDLLGFNMWTIQFWSNSESSFALRNIERHCDIF